MKAFLFWMIEKFELPIRRCICLYRGHQMIQWFGIPVCKYCLRGLP